MVEVTPKRAEISIRYWRYLAFLGILLLVVLVSGWRIFWSSFGASNAHMERIRGSIGFLNRTRPNTKPEDNLASALRLHGLEKIGPRRFALIFSATDSSGSPLTVVNVSELKIRAGETTSDLADTTVDVVTPLHMMNHWTEEISFANVMDYSGSMRRSDLTAVENNYHLFINTLIMPFHAGVIKFNSTSNEILALTGDKTALDSAIAKQVPLQTTALYEGMDNGIRMVQARPHFRFLLLTTDGNNNVHGTTLDEVLQRARTHFISVFVLGFGWLNPANLKKIADETDGYYIYMHESDELSSWFPKIAQIVNNVQVAEFTTPTDYNRPGLIEATLTTSAGILTRSR